MMKRLRGRALAFVALTAILTSISGILAYQLRPLAKAVAVVVVSDGALEDLIPEAIPGFAYTPPAVDDVAAWLDDNTVGSARTLIAEGNELAVMVWDEDASQAVLQAQQSADRAIAFFDNYRRGLMQDINGWFDGEIEEWDHVLAARLSDDEQNLLGIFETSLTAAMAEACSQDAMQRENAGKPRIALAGGDVVSDASVDDDLSGEAGSHQNALFATDPCKSVAGDLDKLRAVSPAGTRSFALAETMRSTLLGQKVKLMVSEAWGQPVAWLKSPTVTAERPVWARLPFLISGCFILSMLAAGLLIALCNPLAVLWRGQAANDDGDGGQIFSDPHWPAKVPQAPLIGRAPASAQL